MSLWTISAGINLVTLGGCWLIGQSLWWGVLAGVVMHLTLLSGVLLPRTSWLCPTVTRGPAGAGRMVALTFDDGPSPAVTPAVLDILASRGVTATFFCIGRWARRYPELIRRIRAGGYELGNHSFLHPRHIYLWSASAISRDARLAARCIEHGCGERPIVFRPPCGFRSPAMARVMRSEGLLLVNFSARAFDTQGGSAEQIERRILSAVRPGSIILLHDGSDRMAHPDRRAMLEALPRILDGLGERGYRVGSVGELMKGTVALEPASRG